MYEKRIKIKNFKILIRKNKGLRLKNYFSLLYTKNFFFLNFEKNCSKIKKAKIIWIEKNLNIFKYKIIKILCNKIKKY